MTRSTMRNFMFGAAVGFLAMFAALLTTTADAKMNELYRSGDWTVSGDKNDSGDYMCVASTKMRDQDGKIYGLVMIKSLGRMPFAIEIANFKWALKPENKYKIKMTFDNDYKFGIEAKVVTKNSLVASIAENDDGGSGVLLLMAVSQSVAVDFPEFPTEPTWIVSLGGMEQAAPAFRECVESIENGQVPAKMNR